jgi:hypothetical protein
LNYHKDGKPAAASKLMVITSSFKGSPDASTITFFMCWVTPTLAAPSPSNRISASYLENLTESFKAAPIRRIRRSDDRDGSAVIVRNELITGEMLYEITFDGKCRSVIKQFTEDPFRSTGLLTYFKGYSRFLKI